MSPNATMELPRKLWQHASPHSTAMWTFMQGVNRTRGRDMQVSISILRPHVFESGSPLHFVVSHAGFSFSNVLRGTAYKSLEFVSCALAACFGLLCWALVCWFALGVQLSCFTFHAHRQLLASVCLHVSERARTPGADAIVGVELGVASDNTASKL